MQIQKLIRKCTAGIAGLIAALTVAGCTQQAGGSSASGIPVTGKVTLTVFDVGKADAMVLQTANTVTVIDTGNKGDGKEIEKFLTAQEIDTIDNLIITHFDKDHVGGAARVLNRLKVRNIYVPDYKSDSDEYLSFIQKASANQNTITSVPAQQKVEWTADDASFRLFAANETDYGKNEENDFSLCLYLQHGNQKFLFAGDAEEARQQELMALKLGEVDFLKFPYHGHYLPTTEQFLDTFAPKVSVVCCSNKEYADSSTVETLQKRGVEAYYTNDGTVTVVSDGASLTCTQTKE